MTELLPHQQEQAEFLASGSFRGNFSAPGTGKTLGALGAVVKAQVERFAIIAPPSALYMWRENCIDFLGCPPENVAVHGTRDTDYPDWGGVIMSYDCMKKHKALLKEWLEGKVSAFICDESHALKSRDTQQTQHALGNGGICESANYSWMLTGTPMTRWHDDFWMFLNRALTTAQKKAYNITNYPMFERKFCRTRHVRRGGRVSTSTCGNKDEAYMKEILFGADAVAVRVTLDEVQDNMPPLTKLSHTLYSDEFAAMEKELHENADEEVLATIRKNIGIAKIPAASEFIKAKLAEGKGSVFVGAWHLDVIAELIEVMQEAGYRVAAITGAVSAEARQATATAFNEGKIDVLIGQIVACGVSLNLQYGGHQIVIVEESFSPQDMAQFYGRLHRMGQVSPVHVDILRANLGIEEAIGNLVARKDKSFQTIMEQRV